MKTIKKYLLFTIGLVTIVTVSCEEPLEIEPKSEFSGSFLDTKEGIEAVLASAYANHQLNGWGGAADYIAANESTTDIFEVYIGAYFNNTMNKYQNFSLI